MNFDKERYLGTGMSGSLSRPLAAPGLTCQIARIFGHARGMPPRAKVS